MIGTRQLSDMRALSISIILNSSSISVLQDDNQDIVLGVKNYRLIKTEYILQHYSKDKLTVELTHKIFSVVTLDMPADLIRKHFPHLTFINEP